jgi:putative acetyltransferase
MLIRRETPQDVDAISAVTTAAFCRRPDAPEPLETALVSRLRADVGWLPALSLVAVTDNAVIGHVVCTRGFVDDTPALGLGPISVLPDRQGGGVGHALMHSARRGGRERGAACRAARRPAFYQRFGFVAASKLGIAAPDPAWGNQFQARAEFGPTRPHGHLSLRLAVRRALSVRQPTAGPETDRYSNCRI